MTHGGMQTICIQNSKLATTEACKQYAYKNSKLATTGCINQQQVLSGMGTLLRVSPKRNASVFSQPFNKSCPSKRKDGVLLVQ